MKNFKFDGHADSLLPDGGEWEYVWGDEFDGPELDRTKWDFRLNFWGKRLETYTTEGVVFDGKSDVELHIVKREDGSFAAPLLQSGSLTYDMPKDSNGFWPFGVKEQPRFMHKYGYYECRCKLQKQKGWWSAFWLQAPGIGSTVDPGACGVECDIMESFEPGKVINNCMHWDGYGPEHKQANIGETAELSLDEYHYFAVDWEPDGYTFYIDGKQRGEKFSGVVSHTEQFVLVHAECLGYRAGKPSPDLQNIVLPDAFVVDHVRVFDRIG